MNHKSSDEKRAHLEDRENRFNILLMKFIEVGFDKGEIDMSIR